MKYILDHNEIAKAISHYVLRTNLLAGVHRVEVKFAMDSNQGISAEVTVEKSAAPKSEAEAIYTVIPPHGQ